jgi:hypothetical protein
VPTHLEARGDAVAASSCRCWSEMGPKAKRQTALKRAPRTVPDAASRTESAEPDVDEDAAQKRGEEVREPEDTDHGGGPV